MRILILFMMQTVLLLSASPAVHAQALPLDFKFSMTAGGSAPWEERATITIDRTGQVHYARYITGSTPAILLDTTFTVSTSGVEQLWKTLQDSSFSTLASKNDSTIRDGEFAKVTVTANGATHQVVIRNVKESRLDGIIASVNAIIPASLRLSYAPPGSLNIIPFDPCGSTSGSMGTLLKGNESRSRPFAKIAADETAPHAGTVVAYNVPIQDAIRKKIVKLSSKGEFFGDGVSITVDNTKAPPSNTISITLFLEFYGPLATASNVAKIEADIAQKWSGLKTSSGKSIDIRFAHHFNAEALVPPSTPGYHEILLVPKDAARSIVTGSPKVNEGTSFSVWAVDAPTGTYGHEAGHLMGLPDRYDDYQKQANGTWSNDHTGQSYGNDDVFAEEILKKFPGANRTEVVKALKLTDLFSMPMDGSENDLMGSYAQKPRQADIDQITANPGVLVTVPAGTIFVNRNSSAQTVITSHREDLFVKPGEKRTRNGIYIVCIDKAKDTPLPNDMFDVAPPIETWQGIAAAASMVTLVNYIDSARLYCGRNSAVQEAIWRITDNTTPLHPTEVGTLLNEAGINIGSQVMDFPHFSPGPSDDSLSQPIVPNELYVATITPRYADGRAGSPVSLRAGVGVPSGEGQKPSYVWMATGPDGAPVAVTAADSTGLLTPKQSGIYEVGVQFSFNDSLYGPRTFTSDRKAYVIVPDGNTETFEHSGLADRFPWKSMGDVPWTISGAFAQTGSLGAHPGSVNAGQSSTLAITVSLPADSAIGFSVRTGLTQSGSLSFSIDSTRMDEFFGISDWQMVKYPIEAGRHLLTWTYNTTGSNPPGSISVDNIFFPGAVAVTAVGGEKLRVPLAFELEQNYPNPFNPTTQIRYGLPHRASVRLSMYNTMGQKVADIVVGTQEAGYHEVTFDGSGLASGMYFYTLRADEFVQTRKLLLVK